MLHYCQSLPLVLRVLGFLSYGKTIHEWKCQLHKLERKLEMRIQNALKISYDGFDCSQKRIFLDIAFLFKGEDRDFA